MASDSSPRTFGSISLNKSANGDPAAQYHDLRANKDKTSLRVVLRDFSVRGLDAAGAYILCKMRGRSIESKESAILHENGEFSWPETIIMDVDTGDDCLLELAVRPLRFLLTCTSLPSPTRSVLVASGHAAEIALRPFDGHGFVSRPLVHCLRKPN
jgi:hypothetical protein